MKSCMLERSIALCAVLQPARLVSIYGQSMRCPRAPSTPYSYATFHLYIRRCTDKQTFEMYTHAHTEREREKFRGEIKLLYHARSS